MPRPRSAGSEQSDIDADGIAEQEQELLKLKQQYRLLENDRKVYAQETQDMIKKQKYVKATLVKVKDTLSLQRQSLTLPVPGSANEV